MTIPETSPENQHKNHLNDGQEKKLPYISPLLLRLVLDEISGGTQQLQEADGGGFFS